MILNLNDTCFVELTDFGKKVYTSYINNLFHGHDEHTIQCQLNVLNESRLKITMWELMQIFGKEMGNGVPKMCFKKNNIEVYKDIFSEQK